LFFALKKNSWWAPPMRMITLATLIAIIGFLVSLVSLAVIMSKSGGEFGPEVPVGWPNRFEMLSYCIWLLTFARKAMQINDVAGE
jgi:hypothetical protein